MREFEIFVAEAVQKRVQRVLQEEQQKVRQEGRQEGRQEVILKLLNADMSVEKLSEITGLSKQEIHNFQEES